MRLSLLTLLWAIPSFGTLTSTDLSSCQRAMQKSPELRELLLGKGPIRLGKDWTTDFLVKTAQEIEQIALKKCPSLRTEQAGAAVRDEYLLRLGFTRAEIEKGNAAILFRALTSEAAVFPALAQKIRKSSPRPQSMNEWLEKIYDAKVGVTEKRIVLIAPDEASLSTLKKMIDTPLADPLVLFRVQLTPRDGVGAFVPELGVLLLSQNVVREMNDLHRFVWWHELTHVAIESARIRGERWLSEFQEFSGWKRKGSRLTLKINVGSPSPDDGLTKLSAHSAFSILPDPVIVPSDFPVHDGFVVAKAHRETAARNNIAEDLADHVAAAKLTPHRFCWNRQALAARKWKWIKEKIDPQLETPSCLK